MGSAGLGPWGLPCSGKIELPCKTQVALVPALLPEGNGLMHAFSIEDSVVHIHGFFPKTNLILVLRNGSALRSYAEQEYDHPVALNNIQHRFSESPHSFPAKAGEPL